MTAYRWRVWHDVMQQNDAHGLLPEGERNNHSLTRVGYIYWSPGFNAWCASYYGGRPGTGGSWAFAELDKARQWVERRLVVAGLAIEET